MKLQHIAIIFLIIILPFVLVLSEFINNEILTLNTQNEYNAKLLDSTYDGIKAYQINTITNSFEDMSQNKLKDIQNAVNTFYSSLSTNFDYIGEKSKVMQEYVPAVVCTLYDGYYIYSPYYNKLDPLDYTTDENDTTYGRIIVEEEYDSNKVRNGLKPYINYSCRYQYNGNDFIITYSLDNFITIEGMINNKYVYDYGYLMTGITEGNGECKVPYSSTGEKKVKTDYMEYNDIIIPKYILNDNITENGYYQVNVCQENLGENRNNDRYAYVKINGTKYYDNNDEIFSYDSKGKRNTQVNRNDNPVEYELFHKAIYNNNSAYFYYKEAYEFTNRVLGTGSEDYNLSGLMASNAEYYNGTAPALGDYKVFDTSDGKYLQDSDSKFNEHRKDIIRKTIETNLRAAISGYKAYNVGGDQLANPNYEYIMPSIFEEDWELLENNVCMIGFMQGMNIGGKIFNSYAVVPNTNTREFVDENDFYIDNVESIPDDENLRENEKNLIYSRITSNSNENLNENKKILNRICFLNTDLQKRRKKSTNSIEYYYPHSSIFADYTTVIGNSDISENSNDMYKYLRDNISSENTVNQNSNGFSAEYITKFFYYMALGKERMGSHNSNFGLKEKDKEELIETNMDSKEHLNYWYYLKYYHNNYEYRDNGSGLYNEESNSHDNYVYIQDKDNPGKYMRYELKDGKRDETTATLVDS